MERAAIDVFHDKKNLLVRLKRLKELCKALMINLLHNLDLPLDALATIGLEQLELLVNFDCDLLVQDFVKTNSHDCIRTLTYSLSNYVVVDIFNVTSLCAELVLFMLALLARSFAF